MQVQVYRIAPASHVQRTTENERTKCLLGLCVAANGWIRMMKND